VTGISPTGVLPAENLRLRPVLCAPGERCGRVPGDGSGSLPAACAGGASAQDPLYTCRLCSARASAQAIAAVALSRHSAKAASNDYGADLATVGIIHVAQEALQRQFPRTRRVVCISPFCQHKWSLRREQASANRQIPEVSIKSTRDCSARCNKLIANFRQKEALQSSNLVMFSRLSWTKLVSS
jgi:hypothetical protein